MRVLATVAPSAAWVARLWPRTLREDPSGKARETKTPSHPLRKMLADGESIDAIAFKLKRTRQPVGARAGRLHLKWEKVKS
jgi:hypothetical protein